MCVCLKECKDAELVRSSVPIARKNDIYENTQPETEHCSDGIAPQPNTAVDGSQKMIVPVVVSMTKYLFVHYRLQMYAYLNNSLRSGMLKRIVGFSFTNRTINREVCTFKGVNYWRMDRLNFWADVSVTLLLSTAKGKREWRGYLCFWFSAEQPGPLTGTIEELTSVKDGPERSGMTLLSPFLIPYFTAAKIDMEAENIWAACIPGALDHPELRKAEMLAGAMGLSILHLPLHKHEEVDSTDSKYMGAKSLKITTQGVTYMHTAKQSVVITPGKTYTFSFYVRKSGAIDVWVAYVYTDASGVSQWVHAPSMMNQLTDDFSRLSYTFTVPENAGNTIQVVLCAGAANGIYPSAWFDCAQLEEGPVANSYNMLINGDFTLNSGAHPTGWNKNSSNTSMDIVYPSFTGTKPEGLSSNTMRMYGTGRTKYAGIYQDIPVSGNHGDVFSAGGWSLNFSKPRKGENFRYNIRVAFLKSGTSTRVNSDSIEWSEEWTDWQFAAGPVIAPCNYTSIRFNVDYERNINYAEFNGLFLHKEEFGKTFAYDDKGNVTSTKNLASMQSYATYDDYNNLLTYRQPGRPASDKYTLEYGATAEEKKKHLLVKSTSPLDIQHTYAYDNKGNVLTKQTQNSTASAFIKGEITYTADQNYVATQADARGKVVTSNIDPATSTLTSVQDPNGQTVNYAYDIMKRITDVHTTADGKTYKNAYSYANDKLMQVSHNTDSDTACDVQYNFAYDAAGQPTTVKVGSQQLSENVYNPDGTLQKIVYGNTSSDMMMMAISAL